MRVLCERCKTIEALTEAHIADEPYYNLLGLRAGDHVHEPKGCERCGGTGFRGRVGVFEVLRVDEEVGPLIGANADAQAIEKAARRAGMRSMLEDGIEKCRTGVTTAAEVVRVTPAY